MKAIKYRTLAAVLALAGTAVILAATGRAADKTLSRSEDPVVIKASALAALADADIASLAALGWDGSALVPIPFQVDERAKDGKFVYTQGPKANPGDGEQKYNGEDELVFMAWDAAGQAPADAASPCEAKRGAEVEVKDGKGGSAWIYVLECAAAPPRSDKDYVQHVVESDRDWVKTDRYHFSEKRGESFFDRLALAGPSGAVGPNLVDRIKGRGHMEAISGLVKIDTPESDLKGSIQCWIDGPVRVVHLMIAFIDLSVIKLNLGGQSENLFYANYFVTPIQVNTPINPGSVLSTFNMRYAIDWRKEMDGAKYYDPVNTKGVTLDGKMSDDEKSLDYETERDWYGLAGPQGNIIVHAAMPEKWRKIVKLKLYYVDDLAVPDAPEEDPGQRCPGFLIDAMADIQAGKYQYNIYYMVPKDPPPGSAPAMLDIVAKPLQTGAKAWP
jgi:hypothetical protein